MEHYIRGALKSRPVIGVILLLTLLILPGSAVAVQPGDAVVLSRARVLIVFGPHYGIPTAEVFLPAITAGLKAGGIPGENIHVEFLDFFRFPDLAGSGETTALLSRKYAATPIDLIVPISQEAVDYVARDLGHLFPGRPMLIPGFEADPAWSGPRRPLIALPTELDIEGTLRLAADLFPAADRLLVITGNDGHSRLFLELISAEAERFPQFREVRHTADLTYPKMLETVGQLPRDTVAVFGTWFTDAAGESFTPAAVAAETAARSSVPVFGLRDVHVLGGLVGGSVIVSTGLAQQTAGIALDYLTGELDLNGDDITLEARHFPLFDWQELARYGADPRKLPDTTVFLNKPESLWDTHRPTVITVGVAFLILTLLTVLLVIQNRKIKISLRAEKQAREALRHSETKHRTLFETMTSGVIYQAADGRITSANAAAERMLRLTFAQMSGKTSMDPRWKMIAAAGEPVSGSDHPAMIALRTGEIVGPVVRGVYIPDEEEYVWLSITAVPLIQPGESRPNQVYAIIDDITSLKNAEDSLKLQLQEKDTLLKELFHRTNNNMQVIQALLRYRLSAHPELPLAQFVEDVIGQIQSMARAQQELFRAEHLSRIDLAEYLPAVVQLVQGRYPDRREAVSISLDLQHLSILLDSAVPLGLVVTELITNAFRHAFPDPREDARAAEITVSCAATETGEIEVWVCDNGIGWSPADGIAASGGGLGLAVVLVEQQLNGTIIFEGNTGTTCVVRFRDDRYEERV